MNNTFKKIAALLLAASMTVLSFASCGEAQNGDVQNGEQDTTLVIGGIGPLTGDYANYGTSVNKGAQLAVDEINAAGGAQGFTFELKFEDSQGNPDSAIAAYGKLMDDGMKVSLGAVLSGETTSVVAAAKDDGLLVLTPSGSADGAIAGSNTSFRICFSDSSQGIASANYIADNGLADKVAVFYASDVDYSKGLYDTFKSQAEVRGIEIVEVQTFDKSTSTDFSTQIQAIKNADVKLIFIPIYAAEAATFLTQAKTAGAFSEDTIFFGCDGLDGILGKIDEVKNAENVMMLTPFAADSADEKTQKFVAAYKAEYEGEVPDQFAADGYDAVYTVVEALKQAEITPEAQADFNERIVAAMTQIEVDGVTGKMTWTADGETNKAALAMLIKDGVAKAYVGQAVEEEAPIAAAPEAEVVDEK